jgi:hypothetical protein
MKVEVEVIIKVTLDVDKKVFVTYNEDCFENAIPDEGEEYRDAAIESEAVALFVQEMDYEIRSTIAGVEVKQTEIREYGTY